MAPQRIPTGTRSNPAHAATRARPLTTRRPVGSLRHRVCHMRPGPNSAAPPSPERPLARPCSYRSTGGRSSTMARTAAICAWLSAFGFGLPGIPAIAHFRRARRSVDLHGVPTYGKGPFEDVGISTSTSLLVAFLVVCIAPRGVHRRNGRGVAALEGALGRHRAVLRPVTAGARVLDWSCTAPGSALGMLRTGLVIASVQRAGARRSSPQDPALRHEQRTPRQ
jgi:hypothetical protein